MTGEELLDAVAGGDADAVGRLLDGGVSPDEADEDGSTAFYRAGYLQGAGGGDVLVVLVRGCHRARRLGPLTTRGMEGPGSSC
ncbi:ankyrin repeat domain-containing protein [Nonomuraea sp. K274]|uniref:Ankyrin repeat domain-containing protein n=1 Tax=Nonomuraea cypriaca TaxID=1187855 RepID=A0A931ARC4_9ACTN|nr:ankyrin repeat domain-containing protein [Nonomuraea cypriaca]MBF8193532.1 ankyrin repeat domain-containing protein [Nonomuraea cypriaca]